jgi:hypothetical protein
MASDTKNLEKDKMMTISKVNIFKIGQTWCFAAWTGIEFDCSYVIDDVDCQDDAFAWVKSKWPSAQVNLISN